MLIGLTGAAGSGKDTVCRLIQEWGAENGLTVRREAFADRLKLSACRIFFPLEQETTNAVATCDDLKEIGTITLSAPGRIPVQLSGREFLQRYGTECHRDVFGQDFWIDAALQDLSAAYTIVTDVRFPNEAAAVHKYNGELWRKASHGDEIAESEHASELALPDDQVDVVIPAFETLESLSIWVHSEMDLIHQHRASVAVAGW